MSRSAYCLAPIDERFARAHKIRQLEDLSRVQRRFVSDVSHELRTPLTTVRMAADVLHEARSEFDPATARSAELLQTQLDRFESLLSDLLEISRYDAGAAVLDAETIDLLHSVTGSTPSTLHVVGGGARNALLCGWTASAAGLPVVAGPEEATVVGNLLVQAMALGEIGSLQEARDVVRASFEPVVYEPAPDAGWQEARARFAGLASDAGLERIA